MGAKKQNKSRRKVKVARRRKARRRGDADAFKQLEPSQLHKLVNAVSILHGCGVDLFATGHHPDPRMNLTLADIKAQYPWLAEIGKVFR